MNNEKEWHELRRKVMYSDDIDEEANHWKEIDRKLKERDKMEKFLSKGVYNLFLESENVSRIDIFLKNDTNPFWSYRPKHKETNLEG